jgi:DNA-binding CsgD family transcriptional regulator
MHGRICDRREISNLSRMSDTSQDPIVVAVSVDDPVLADRLTALLADIPGLRLAAAGEHGDVVLMGGQGSLIRDGLEPALTPREVEVLSLLAEGASNKAIAHRLGISVHTAKFHVGQVIDKLDATGRTDAVAHAARLGILHL